jgi:hypothetical protein
MSPPSVDGRQFSKASLTVGELWDIRRVARPPRYCGFSAGGLVVVSVGELPWSFCSLVEEADVPFAPALADSLSMVLQAASERTATDANAPMVRAFMSMVPG